MAENNVSTEASARGILTSTPDEPVGLASPDQVEPQPFHISMIFVFLFTLSYCVLGVWLLFDGWLNSFSSVYWLWSIEPEVGIPPIYELAMMSLVGSILGCGTLDIVSFHKYVAIEKKYDVDHIWGYFISPVLASIIGLIVFALFQSGLLIFSGGFSSESTPTTATLGFTAVGFVAGYSWPDAVAKFRDVSKSIFQTNKREKSTSTGSVDAPTTNGIQPVTDQSPADTVQGEGESAEPTTVSGAVPASETDPGTAQR